ncbi:MAG: hypothetical protein K2H63_08485 [Paramuribaculum sp.]|nr:hypothetical protein [Paramuribaculum sp.]
MGIFDFFRSNKKEKDTFVTSSQYSNGEIGQIIRSLPNGVNEIKGLDSTALLTKLREIADDSTEYQISHGAMCYCPAVIKRKYKPCKCSLCSRKIGNFEVDDYRDIVKQSGQIKKTGLAEVKIVCIDCLVDMCKSGNYTYDIKDWDIYESFERDYKRYNDIDSCNIDSDALLKWVSQQQKIQRERRNCPSEGDRDTIFFDKREYEEPDYLVFLFKTADSDKPRLTVTYPYALEYFLSFVQNRRTWKSWNDATILLRDNIQIIERLTGLKL